MNEIHAYIQQQRALGTSRFQVAIKAELQRVTHVRQRGDRQKNCAMLKLTMSNIVSDPFTSCSEM